MLKTLRAAKATIAVALTLAVTAAHGAGDSGTGSVTEIQLSGAQLGMLFGGAVALGIVIWLVTKLLHR